MSTFFDLFLLLASHSSGAELRLLSVVWVPAPCPPFHLFWYLLFTPGKHLFEQSYPSCGFHWLLASFPLAACGQVLSAVQSAMAMVALPQELPGTASLGEVSLPVCVCGGEVGRTPCRGSVKARILGLSSAPPGFQPINQVPGQSSKPPRLPHPDHLFSSSPGTHTSLYMVLILL